jgi:hypothetical protein
VVLVEKMVVDVSCGRREKKLVEEREEFTVAISDAGVGGWWLLWRRVVEMVADKLVVAGTVGREERRERIVLGRQKLRGAYLGQL